MNVAHRLSYNIRCVFKAHHGKLLLTFQMFKKTFTAPRANNIVIGKLIKRHLLFIIKNLCARSFKRGKAQVNGFKIEITWTTRFV